MCPRLGKGANNLKPGLGLTITARGEPFPGLAQQALHAERSLPRGQRVVAYLYHAAGADLGREYADDSCADRVGHPAPQTMKRSNVRFKDFAGAGIVRHSGEISLDEPGVRDTGLDSESASGSDVSRVEVDAGYPPGRIADGER